MKRSVAVSHRQRFNLVDRQRVVIALGRTLFALAAVCLECPCWVRTDDLKFPARVGERSEVGDGAALISARTIDLALLLDLDLTHHVAHRAGDLVSRIGNRVLKSF